MTVAVASTTDFTNAASVVSWLRERGVMQLVSDSRALDTLSDASHTAFLAWPGAAVDARAFIPHALQKGVAAVLMASDSPLSINSVAMTHGANGANGAFFKDDRVKRVSNLKALSGEIASLFYENPSHQLQLVAVTGTNGKTSTSYWLAQALSALPQQCAMPCAVVGTLGMGRIHQSLIATGLTTPDPVLLQAHLRHFADSGCAAVALEASSIGLAEGRLAGARIHTAIFTNFTQDHLDYHGTMEAYWQAKLQLFLASDLKAAVINMDDPQGLVLLDALQSLSLDRWTYALDKPARLQATDLQFTASGCTFCVVEQTGKSVEKGAKTSVEIHTLNLALVGRYNVSNVLGVIAAMRSLGIPLEACCQACYHITSVPGRLERVSQARQPLVVVDYAHTPDALEKVLQTLREMSQARGGKLWCVFGCGGNRDTSKRPIMGAMAYQHADQVVITSDNPRDENPAAILAQILLGMNNSPQVQVQVDRALAIEQTIAQTTASDVVLIAGKGHENYQEIAGIRHAFSDQAVARQALTSWDMQRQECPS